MKEKKIGKNPNIQEIVDWAEQNGFVVQFRLIEKNLPNKALTSTVSTDRKNNKSKSKMSSIKQVDTSSSA